MYFQLVDSVLEKEKIGENYVTMNNLIVNIMIFITKKGFLK